MMIDADSVLWQDTGIFRSRYEKSASALIAVKEALERNRPLRGGEQEFLDLYQIASGARPEHFGAVWSDPAAYFWVRMAYQLIATCLTSSPLTNLGQAYCTALGMPDPREALTRHLADFKRYVLALHCLSERDCAFTRPLQVTLPFAIPATRLSLTGKGSAQIHALVNGYLEISHEGRTQRLPLTTPSSANPVSLTIEECPVVSHEGYELLLQPHGFNLLGLDFVEPVLKVGHAYQREHAHVVAQALSLLDRYLPDTYAQFRSVMRYIALKPLLTGGYTNSSHSDLPGAFVCGIVHEPYELADGIIHEFYHNRLFFIEEIAPFFSDSADALENRSYYSPWRSDLRPLHGILHALYVYLPVCRFWLQVSLGGEVAGMRLSYVHDQLVRIPLQLQIAVHQLSRHARFTDFGRAVFEQLKKDVADLQDAITGPAATIDVPAVVCSEDGSFTNQLAKSQNRSLSVREAVLEHLREYDRHKQCDGILDESSRGDQLL